MVTVLLDHPETYVPEQASTAPMGDPHKMMAPAGYVCPALDALISPNGVTIRKIKEKLVSL